MPSKKQYDLVSDDGYDARIPLHNEDAFQHGIQFQAKYIGTLDVPRPSSRVEIVAAMRRIRYEFKVKAIQKKKVDITVSVDGVKIVMRRSKPKVPLPFVNKNKDDWAWDENRLLVMSHPIYRIFYVSHDSQDLKIFSYIARDGSTNVFKCNVFKAHKKSEAMRLVRTIGQAFEVCHKMSINNAQQEASDAAVGAENKPIVSSDNDDDTSQPKPSVTSNDQGALSDTTSIETSKASTLAQSPMEAFQEAQQLLQHAVGTLSQPPTPQLVEPPAYVINADEPLPITARHRIDYLRHQLEQQQQQTQVTLAHVALLKDQLTAETLARQQAQARTHNLLVQNRELLEHINALVRQLQELEARITGTDLEKFDLIKSPIQQLPMPEVTSPEPGPTFIPAVTELDLSTVSGVQNSCSLDNTNIRFMQQIESPDSGHREMSSDSLVYNVIPNDVTLGHTPGGSLYGPALLPGAAAASCNGIVNGDVIPVAEPRRFKVIDSARSQRSAQNEDRINGNPFISSSHGGIVNSNPIANGFKSDLEKSDRENNNKTMPPSGTASGARLDSNVMKHQPQSQRSVQGQTSAALNSSFSLTDTKASVIGNKSFNDNKNNQKTVAGEAVNNSAQNSAKNSAQNSAKNSAQNSAKNSSDTKELSKSGHVVDTAKKEGVLKTLNLNLKSLSPHKRHSSTSAELYGRAEDGDATKAAIQSSSESKLLRHREKKEEKKASVFAVAPVKS